MTSPLRPDLYNRLSARARHYGFGRVIVAHEGEAMVSHVETESDGRKKLEVTLPGEYLRVNCPFCTDTRRRLWINHRWGYPDPQTGKNLWLARCYNENCLAVPGNVWKLYKMVYDDVTNGRDLHDPILRGERPTRVAAAYRPPGLVYPLQTLPADHPACAYLLGRGFDPHWLGRHLGVGYCLVADADFRLAADRLVVPVVMRGEHVGWQARYLGTPPDKTVPKYLTMPGMKKTQALYNFDVARTYPFVVLTEGPTKVWRVGPEAVALLGAGLSGFQAQLVVQCWKTVVVYLDGDAQDKAEEAMDALAAVPNRVLLRLGPGQEPGDFDVAYNRAFLYHEALRQGVRLPVETTA